MHQVIEVAGGQLEYTCYGVGTAVLFFHGGHGNCFENHWHKGFDPRHYQLISPSRPGYGQSSLLDFTAPETTAALMAMLLDDLDIERCLLVGVSAGGPAAIAFAALFPERTLGLVLISAVTTTWLKAEERNYKRALKLFSPQREIWSWRAFRWFYRLAPHTAAKTMFKELSSYPRPEIFEEEISELRQMLFKQASGHGFINDLLQVPDPGLLNMIKAPSLILHSLHDKVVDLEHPRLALRHIAGSRLQTFDNRWGHLLYLGVEGEAVTASVQNFCRRYRRELKDKEA